MSKSKSTRKDYGNCLNPQHKKPAKAATRRGLCQVCYRYAKALVSAGKTTWEQMEKDGYCKPIVKDNPVGSWFSQKYGDDPVL